MPEPPVDLAKVPYVASVPDPAEIRLTWSDGAYSLGLVAAAAVLIGFPGAIFNGTFTSNYNRIMRFGAAWRRRKRIALPGWARLALGILASATISTLARPGLGFGAQTLVVLLAGAVASLVASMLVEMPMWLHMRSRTGYQRTVRLYPGGFVIALAFALLTWIAELQPGYIYGTLVGMAYLDLDRKDAVLHGKFTAIGYAVAASVGFAAWFLRTPFNARLAADPASVPLLAITVCLGALFVTCVQSAVFALMPLKFMSGKDILTWSRAGWAALQFTLAVGFAYIFLSPATPRGSSAEKILPAAVLFVSFALFSFAFWGYFRWRPTPPEQPEPARADVRDR
ncbi:FGLLP motif-containing membrane protein [Saccharothrix sp. NPDC042600]|uniref:FGLLP motif-containing membrane protein n=1 Tax=Saccharothrix TaxID=2071 RepID=UPI0033F441CD|nr:hypothetical protein GCM10017745_49270 [Saccharothrix mutabilis subsp. capreolus]